MVDFEKEFQQRILKRFETGDLGYEILRQMEDGHKKN
jgi:hypothetical protein